MGAIATFSYSAWRGRYPEFSAVTLATAEQYFAEACIYHRNDGCGPVRDETVQRALLNMLTAHIAARYSNAQGSPNPGTPQDPNSVVGRIQTASEGSVSVSTQNDYAPGSAQWFQQTKYGSDYWNATRAYRTALYLANPTVVVNTAYPLYPAVPYVPRN